VRICALGDLLLDVIVRLDEPLSPGADARAETRLGAGGQAANVAAWAVELGAAGRFVGKRGGDEAGRLAAAELERRGVELAGPVAAERNGVVVSLVEPGGARTMASDRGSSPDLSPDALEAAWFACDALHLSGYSLMRSPIVEAAVRAAELARAAGARVSVDLSSWTHIERFGATLRPALAEIAPDTVFGNEREWEALGEVDATTRVVKRGARGIVVDGVEHAAHAADVVDTTGAGDALAAGFLVGGVDAALAAAARCIAQVGAMP
jgi:sugar/nucleoside kinase (ribokinase family)